MLLESLDKTFKGAILVHNGLHLCSVPNRKKIIRDLCDHPQVAKSANDRRKELLIFGGAALEKPTINCEELKTGYMSSFFSVLWRIPRIAICRERPPSRCLPGRNHNMR